ncbi:hypothetical protein [Oculatella sp. LEGE 06141]|nr:hypothetical protein [Oculatella sp. LEGE 06141]
MGTSRLFWVQSLSELEEPESRSGYFELQLVLFKASSQVPVLRSRIVN